MSLATLRSKVVLAHQFNHDTNDSAGKRTASTNNGATRQHAKVGTGSYYYDGSNDQTNLDGQLATIKTSLTSVSFWINPSAGVGIYRMKGSTTNFRWGIEYKSSTSQIRYQVRNGTGTVGVNYYTVDLDTAIPLNKWSHVVIQKEGASLGYYINGVSTTVTTGYGTNSNKWVQDLTTTSFTSLSLGSERTDSFFQGYLDQVLSIDRALTLAEIQEIYNKGFGIKYTQLSSTIKDDVISAYEFNESDISGTSITDLSGNGNTATNVGATLNIIKIGTGSYLFDNSNDYLSSGNIGNIKSVSFWIRATDATSESIIDLNGTATITTNASDAILANNFTSPTIYVNGSTSSSVIADVTWAHVVITTDTNIAASSVNIGRISSAYFGGYLDNIVFYNDTLDSTEVSELYNSGTGLELFPGIADGQVAYYKFDGDALDTTQNGNNGTVSGATLTTGKIGQGYDFVSTGSNNISLGSLSNVKDITMWLNLDSTTEPIYEEVVGTGVQVSSGTLLYPSCDNAFVNNVDTNTITTGWKFLNITSTTVITTTAMTLGKLSTSYGNFIIDEVGLWNRNIENYERTYLYADGTPTTEQQWDYSAPLHYFVNVYNGTSWVSKIIKVYDGTSWVSKPLKFYNGSTWVTI